MYLVTEDLVTYRGAQELEIHVGKFKREGNLLQELRKRDIDVIKREHVREAIMEIIYRLQK